jgi:hypothetical protein
VFWPSSGALFSLPPEHSNWLWRASLIFGAVPALLIILFGVYLTESPIWLANQGDLKGQLKFYKNPMQLMQSLQLKK